MLGRVAVWHTHTCTQTVFATLTVDTFRFNSPHRRTLTYCYPPVAPQRCDGGLARCHAYSPTRQVVFVSKRRGQKVVYGRMLTEEAHAGIGDENALAAVGEWRLCASRCDILLLAPSSWLVESTMEYWVGQCVRDRELPLRNVDLCPGTCRSVECSADALRSVDS